MADPGLERISVHNGDPFRQALVRGDPEDALLLWQGRCPSHMAPATRLWTWSQAGTFVLPQRLFPFVSRPWSNVPKG